jgi:YVTN family beta-propeller protein
VTYGYRIHAMNGFGMDSVGLETTCVAQASGASAPGAFTLAAPAAVCSNGGPEVDLTWTASQSATTYDLYRDGALYKSGATAGTAFSNIANLAPGQHCTYQVVARNASGTTPSNTVDVLIPQDVCTASLPTVPAGTTPGDPAGPGPVLGSVTATLTWGQADRATLYEVTVRDLASGALVVDTTTTALSAPVTLDAGKPYRWSVAAGNAAGFSAYSSPDYFQTPGLAVPSAPTGLAPGGSSAPGTTVTTLTPTLFWTASSGAASYAVVVVDVGTQAKILAQAVPGTSVVCPSLTQGRTYAWSVSASNASGTGVAAPLVFFTVAAQGGTVPAVPTGLAPGGSSAPGTTVTTLTPTLSWTASQGATSYAVVVVDAGSQAQVLAQSVSGTSVVCPSLTLGRTYAWSVSASNASGTGVAAPLVFFTVAAQGGTVPAVPTGLAPGGSSAPGTTVTTLTPTLSWTASQGATSYAVVVVDAGSQAQVLAQSVSGTSVVCPSLTLGRTYAWSVSASNTAGTSAAAPLAFFTTNVPPATHQVSGTVKGGAAGWTLQLQTGSGASLTSTTTSANGAYAFSGLSDGAYTVLAPNVNGWVISPSQISVTVSGADATADFTATGTNIYSVSGAVTGAASAAVLTLVGTTGTLSQVTTSGNGSFAFNGLASGNYTVTPSSSGLVFSPTSAAVSVGPAPGSATNVNFAATPRTASDVTTIPTGLYPKALTVDPANGKVYSANGDGTATIIDGTTDAPVSVGVGLGSVAVVANPASLRAYVANFNGGTVSVLDGTTNAVVATVPVTGLPQALALDPAGNRVYALGQGGVVSVVDGNSNSVAATITAGTGPDAAAVSPVDRKVYVANGGSNTVTVMDASNAVAATLAVGSVPVAVLAHPTMNLVYVLNFGDADVTVLDGAALKATATVPVGKGPVGMVFNPNHNKIYVVDRDGCALSVIDAGTQKVLATVPMGKYPVAAAVNTTTDKVYVVNQTDATVTVVDSFTDAVMTTVAVGAAPAAVAVNVLNNKVYVANSGASSLALIDGSTYHISGKVTGTSQPLTFTLANAAGGIITTATTDASGAFSFSGLVNATYTVIAPVVAGYVVSPAQVPVSVGGGDGMVSFSAASLSTYSILGTVSGAPSGVAVGLADATGATVATVWTDAGGGYAFQSLASGTYTVTPVLAHFAFTPSSVPVSVAGSTAATVDFKASPTWPTAVTTVTTGGNPELMVVNPSNNKIYIEKSDGTMTVVNGATHGTTSMPLGQGPAGMALVPCTLRVVVAESNAGSVSIVDCTSDTVMATLQVGQFPGAVGANVSNGKVYVVNTSGGTVSVIDTYANTVQATVQVGQSPCAVAVNSSDGKAYVANASSNTVSILDGSNKVVATVAAGSLPNAIALEASKNKVYAINFGDNTLTVIDGASAQAVATVSVGRGPQALVTNPGNHKVYVANQDGTVTVIDAGSDTVLATVTVGSAPVSLDLDPTTNQVYVVNQISNTVTVIDGTTDQATLQVNVGQTPKAVAVNPNDHKVYVTNQSAGTLSVFDGASYRVTGTCQGAVASGVSVTLTGPNVPALTALSDANGAFVLPCIVDGTYTLTPVKTGFTFTPASLSLTLKDADGSVNFIATAAP